MMSYADLYLGGSGPLISGSAPSAGSGGSGGGGDNGDGNNNSSSAGPACSVFGVPFDATHSYRPGCRFGPGAIRSAFHNIEVFHPEMGVDLEAVPIRDLGDMPHTASPERMIDSARRVTEDLLNRGQGPVFMLGGEHLATYGTYTAFPKNVGYAVFDAHYDLRDEYGDVRLNHATYLRRIAEERGTDCMLHIGARAFAAEELAYLRDSGIRTISDSDVRDGGAPSTLRDFASSFDSVYVSFDLDVLDPAFAPGVGNPEAEGITPRELFGMARALASDGIRVAGGDIVELNPSYDTGATAALAAKILSTLVAASQSFGRTQSGA